VPNLLIARVGGIWKAAPANSGVEYVFQTIEGSQEPAVQQLAAAMKEGAEAVINGADEIFVVPPGTTSETVVETLFSTTDTLTYEARIIWGTVGEDFLIDDLAEAGEALALALP
jgi:hypothetical protein